MYKGLQGATAHTMYTSHSQEHRGEPLLFSISALGSFTCVTQYMGPTALRSIRRTKQWLSVLLKDTSVTALHLNPHSADQKHQSLNLMLLTAQPRHLQWTLPMKYANYIHACVQTLLVGKRHRVVH